MQNRCLVITGAWAMVIATGWLAPVSVVGQTATTAATSPPAAAQPWTPPRTADGRPDLQGVWDWATITPLERPRNLIGKDVLTDEEAAALERQAAEARVDSAPTAGNTGTYNQFWYDRGTKATVKRSSLIVDPPDGRIPPLTPEMQKREEARAAVLNAEPRSHEDRSLSERCIVRPWSGPPMTPGNYNNLMQLFQSPNYVVLYLEQNHDARIIPLDGRPHVDPGVRLLLGDSRGHWEGDTLVVDTTNFTDYIGKTNFRGAGGNMHLIERFTRVDAVTLHYEFTVEDPTAYTRPWTAAMPMTKTDDKVYEYACHEGDYSVENVLRGSRAQEVGGAALPPRKRGTTE